MWTIAVFFYLFTGCLCRSTESQQAPDPVLEVIKVVNLTNAATTVSVERIIGGVATNIERYPYTVQVMQNNQLTCGGSLLTSRTVLSAAHCFIDKYGNVFSYRMFSIRAGSSTLNSGGQTRSVSKIIPHEQYNRPIRDNDIAVLILASGVTLGGTTVGVAAIPSQWAEVPDDSSVTHVGWGRTNINIPVLSTTLQEVTVFTVNRNICANNYGYLGTYLGESFPVTTNMICAGMLGIGGRDACQGDSGGPLIYNGVVVGVTSWGYSCAEPWYPGVSARVSSYTQWINRTVTDNGVNASKASTVILLATLFLASGTTLGL